MCISDSTDTRQHRLQLSRVLPVRMQPNDQWVGVVFFILQRTKQTSLLLRRIYRAVKRIRNTSGNCLRGWFRNRRRSQWAQLNSIHSASLLKLRRWLKVQAIFNEMQISSQCQPTLKCDATAKSGIADCQEASEIRILSMLANALRHEAQKNSLANRPSCSHCISVNFLCS